MGWMQSQSHAAHVAQRWLSSRWALVVAVVFLLAYLCSPYLIEEGWEAIAMHGKELSLNLALHLAAIRIVVPVLLLLLVAITALAKNATHTQALRAMRMLPCPALAEAAEGIAAPGQVFLLADERPYAACIGLWRPAIYVSAGLVRQVSPAALRAAIAHEEAHRRWSDPARLLALRIVISTITPVPWLSALIERMTLRAEIRADRYACERTSTRALAEALLAVLKGSPFPASGQSAFRQQQLAATNLAGGHAHSSPEAAAADLALRLRYLQLPPADALPPALPPGLTLGRIVRSLLHTLPYGLTGRRGSPLVLVLVCVLPWAEAWSPWANMLMDLLYI